MLELNFAESTKWADINNGWVEDKTKKKIKNLISPDSLSGDTHMILVNAIYMKGDYKFDTKNTQKQPFFPQRIWRTNFDQCK